MKDDDTLHILWTNADPDTSLRMVMMYATNSMARGWWEQVTVIIWGATAKLAAENAQVREAMQTAMHAGVKFSACVACARQLGVVEALEQQGVEVIGWGEQLTELLKDGRKLITV
jgi:hypothetical protein